MAISDNPSRQAQKSKVRRSMTNPEDRSWWSDTQKLEAVQTYLMLGNVCMTGRVLKIPEETVRRWRKTTWWKEIEGELRIQDEMQLSARLKKIVEKTLDAVDDRLDHGDYVYDQKTGQMRRKPVSMKDAHKVAMDLVDKRDKILNRHQPDASEEQMNDKLLKMMKQFADFAQGKLVQNSTVEAEDVEVKMVSDENFSGEVRSDTGEPSPSGLVQEGENSPGT